jgi:DNA-binding MarR family transcriptional regulator
MLSKRDWEILDFFIKVQGKRDWFALTKPIIAEKTGWSEKSVALAMHQLSNKGCVRVVEFQQRTRGAVGQKTVTDKGREMHKIPPVERHVPKEAKRADKPKGIEDKVTEPQCKLMLALQENGEMTNGELAAHLKIPKGTVDCQVLQLEKYEMINTYLEIRNKRKQRYNRVLSLGRKMVKMYKAGHEFRVPSPRLGSLPPAGDRPVKRGPPWTFGIIYEDARVRREVPKYVPHAASIPWKGKDSLAE